VLGAADVRSAHRDWLLQILKATPERPQDREVIQGLIQELETPEPASV